MTQTLINVSAAKAEALSEFLGAINEAAAKTLPSSTSNSEGISSRRSGSSRRLKSRRLASACFDPFSLMKRRVKTSRRSPGGSMRPLPTVSTILFWSSCTPLRTIRRSSNEAHDIQSRGE